MGTADTDPSKHPVLSIRANGDRTVGERGPLARELYAAGTPPMHGFAAKAPVVERVAMVRIGDELRVERRGDVWVALDDDGVLGQLRWLPGYDGKLHAVTGLPIRLPAAGVLHVRRLVLDPDGIVKDIEGEVTPI